MHCAVFLCQKQDCLETCMQIKENKQEFADLNGISFKYLKRRKHLKGFDKRIGSCTSSFS